MPLMSTIGRRVATVAIALLTAGSGVAVTATSAAADVGDQPTITSLSPDNGPEAGGNTLTITGTDFIDVTSVRFGIIDATSYTVVDDTTITAVVPADPFPAPNGFDVSVTTAAGGPSVANDNTGYTYNDTTPDPPAITSLSPDRGPAAGGTRVTISGTGFSGDSTVRFGNVPATDPTFDPASGTITVDSPADAPAPAAGNVDRVLVTVTEGGQASNGVRFTYGVAPVVSSISPSSGPDSGGTDVTITGRGFSSDSTVRFGGVTADPADVRFVSATTLEVTTPPAGFPGTTTFGVFVTNPYGTSNGDQTFTYNAKAVPNGAPTLTAGPATVPFGSIVTLSGTSDPGATVQIFFHVKGQVGFDSRRSLTVDQDGKFSTTYKAIQDETYYAQVGEDTTRQSAQGVTQVAPTVAGPAARVVKLNSTAVISGRAGIDSDTVLIHFHKAGTPLDDYSIVRSVPVNENGQYTRPYKANVDYRFFVTSENGQASPKYLYQAR